MPAVAMATGTCSCGLLSLPPPHLVLLEIYFLLLLRMAASYWLSDILFGGHLFQEALQLPRPD